MRRSLLTAIGSGVLPSIGASFMGGYYAGIIDTTKGNIIAADASQTGKRYALIVSPKSLETSGTYRATLGAPPAATFTRWDGLTATAAMNSTTYPAAHYCAGLTYPADAASAWYLPAMDELEVLYRNLKPLTANNLVYTETGSTFPGGSQDMGYNPSSDPAGAAYTATSPAQTTVTAFQTGNAQALDGGGYLQYWSATAYDSTADAWSLNLSNPGQQRSGTTNSSNQVRPVRRLILT